MFTITGAQQTLMIVMAWIRAIISMLKTGDTMNFYIQQSIHIHFIKIGGITNSSVLQIGSAGIIKPASYLYNTGNFTEPAPEAEGPAPAGPAGGSVFLSPSVPLTGAQKR